MTAKRKFIRHTFAGGWATDLGLTSESLADEAGRVSIPFLINAENVEYDLDGGPKKIGGATKLNATTVESGEEIRGLYDYWRQGTSGTPTQKRVIHAGTKILKEDVDGVFDDLFTGLEDGKIPAYEAFDDILIIASDSTTDVPKSWDQTTAQNLAGTPPNFSFMRTHKNRVWAAGDAANPSKLYFSVLLDPEDWVGAGSGSIDIDPGDGDRITALISFKDDLWVFKGPFKGSIHRITGSAPTGDDAFARKPFIKKLGCVAHNSVFSFKDDIGFMWSDGTIHSLRATSAFGDFNESSLTREINTYIKQSVNLSRLDQVWAVTDERRGRVLITLPVNSSTTNNQILVMDYRFDPIRWASWPVFSCASLASVIDTANNDQREIFGGFNDGFVRKLNRPNKSIDAITAIPALITTPYIYYGSPVDFKTLSAVSVGISPQGNYDLTFRWRRDDNTQQSVSIDQGGGAFLSPSDVDEFTLGTSQLGGAQFIDRFAELEEGGEFRTIQFELLNSGVDEGMEIHSMSADIGLGSKSFEN